jgi:hypothetical protein
VPKRVGRTVLENSYPRRPLASFPREAFARRPRETLARPRAGSRSEGKAPTTRRVWRNNEACVPSSRVTGHRPRRLRGPDYPNVHLVEVTVGAAPGSFDVGSFAQEDPSLPEDSWQTAYNEWYLSPEGEPLEEFDPPDAIRSDEKTRLAFFLHFVDFSRPLETPFNSVELPTPTPASARLNPIQYDPVT